MLSAKLGDTAVVHYIGRLKDGTVFDASTPEKPLQFLIGSSQVLPGFE